MDADQSSERTPIEIDFERFFEQSVDVMVVTRPDGWFERVNPAMARLLGTSVEEILASPWTRFVHPDDRDMSVDENVREFEESGHRTMRFVNRYVDVAGEIHWMDWNAEVDPVTGLVYGSARDVTADRQDHEALEQARATAESASRAKSELLSRTSDTLRTPLNAILGFGQLLERGDLDDEQRACVQQILVSGQQLVELVDEMLERRDRAIEPVPAGPGSTGTILYIEDNPENARLVERLLIDRPGQDLVWASGGALGVEMAVGTQPDLILLDLHLPDLPGDDVLDRLRREPRTADIPVIVLSADATEPRIQALLRAGAAAYLTKPFDLDHLLATIDHHLPG
ncbi:MAG: response regulator [Acidimicrobiales bacterium]